ncbi:hypothetical protein S3E15_02894 [Bacillus mycoides]|uniref:Uncharacterized protein n=1 Tax=Bacillus mycoides TaxID=1405 RepID=A0AAP8BCH9_BACMY|nr:hypothetical protein M2E15_4768 [Bacillus mycoides]OSX89858.1 hypothetical protein S3E15_02894 [Bacillus mycoides]OSY02843.1 hypothetical protein S2E19_03341 [Bacillus mycoides]OSY03384.1 hypothetical protein BTJ44_05322 [Bacillus mycoides]OSY07244.1 hypothetical protein BTJ48_03260 [Bacillus mycoides]
MIESFLESFVVIMIDVCYHGGLSKGNINDQIQKVISY